jgi:hypothetical protein
MEAVRQAIAHTPIWVWFVLAGLIYLGLRRMRPRSISLGRLILLPGIFLVLSAYNALSNGLPALEAIGIWLVGLALGSLIGRLAVPRNGVVVNRKTRRIAVPGSVVPLILILVIFIGRYASGYTFGRWPELRHDPLAMVIAAGYAALCTGIMIGRTAPLVLAYFRAVPLDGGKAP